MDFTTILETVFASGNIVNTVLLIVLIIAQQYFKSKSGHNDDEIIEKLNHVEIANTEIREEVNSLTETMLEKFSEFEETDLYIISRLNNHEDILTRLEDEIYSKEVVKDEIIGQQEIHSPRAERIDY